MASLTYQLKSIDLTDPIHSTYFPFTSISVGAMLTITISSRHIRLLRSHYLFVTSERLAFNIFG